MVNKATWELFTGWVRSGDPFHLQVLADSLEEQGHGMASRYCRGPYWCDRCLTVLPQACVHEKCRHLLGGPGVGSKNPKDLSDAVRDWLHYLEDRDATAKLDSRLLR